MVKIFMVDINEQRYIHKSDSPEFSNIYHNPDLVWSETHVINDVNDGDIVVQYYTKGRGNYFIFGRSHGTSFQFTRPECHLDTHDGDGDGKAIIIVDVDGPHKIRGDILDYIRLYTDGLSYDIFNDIQVEENYDCCRSFISIAGKKDIWEVKPGLCAINEE